MQAEERGPLERYEDMLKVFPPRPNFMEVYQIDPDKTIGYGGQANVFLATINVDGKNVQVAAKRGRFKLTFYEEALDLHLYKREAELHRQL